MTKSRIGPHEILVATLTTLSVLFLFPASGLAAEDEDDAEEAGAMSILPQTPDWLDRLDASGRYVGIFGSRSKFREDHNIQTGANLGAGVYDEIDEERSVFFDGLFQPVERQGYGRFGYKKLGGYSIDAKAQSWTEFYNTRPGVDDVTVLGTRLDPSGVFPNTTNARALFGGGKPAVDWLTITADGHLDLPGPSMTSTVHCSTASPGAR